MDPLWVDKYRPKSLEKLSYHQEITEVLGQLADTSDFPVILS
jgi:replication factor C subunit 3/5